MNILNNLFENSSTTSSLSLFIRNNSTELYDFFISQKNSSIVNYRKEIENYILPKFSIYRHLNFFDNKNQSFILYLLDVSERFSFYTEFEQLYHLAKNNNILLSSRLEAASKFLIGITKFEDYENRISNILHNLTTSFFIEDEIEEKITATLIRFYTEVFYNFSHNIPNVFKFKQNLQLELQKDETRILFNSNIIEVLSYSLEDIEQLYNNIQHKLDEILDNNGQYFKFNIESHLIESNTEYVELLANIALNFNSIKTLCTKLYKNKQADSNIFNSLGRGVAILTEQNQLVAYISSYGNMHYAKMITAITPIKNDFLKSTSEIYDWGCGQALASICFLEYLISKNINTIINKITLIEPSEIAIKRAALHVKKFNSKAEIITINKDLDSLKNKDFKIDETITKVHLFSNILDIDMFSMTALINRIKENFKGLNLFICVSPYISNFKTQRIDDFVQSFENNIGFQIIYSISEKNGEWGDTNWTRVIRVFKCLID